MNTYRNPQGWQTAGETLDYARLAMLAGDTVDYRAMLAREVYSERHWRMRALPVLPRECARIDMTRVTLRERLERVNGEALA